MFQIQDLEEELGRVTERLSETEAEAMSQMVSHGVYTLLYCTEVHFTVLYGSTLYCTVRKYTVLYYTSMY